MTGAVDERDRLLTRLVTFQKVQARLDAEAQDTLVELAALPVPSFLGSCDKQCSVPDITISNTRPAGRSTGPPMA